MKLYKITIAVIASLLSTSFATAQEAPCGTTQVCPTDGGVWAQRLQDAWKSSATTIEQRNKMTDIIAANNINGVTNWQKAASDYFSWRNGNPYDLEKASTPFKSAPSPGQDYGAMRRAAETYIRGQLIDPASALFEWPNGFASSSWQPLFKKRVYGIMTCGFVNSRNRMGGYSGKSAFVVVMAGTTVTFFDMDDEVGRSKGLVEQGCEKGADRVLPPPQKGMLE